jgi:hypothetical protein
MRALFVVKQIEQDVVKDEARNARCECQTGHLSLSAAATGGIW